MTLAKKALEIALKQDGVCEKPKNSNSGPEVNIYLKSVALPPGNAWCMAFVFWCVETASRDLNCKNPLVKTGHVLSQWNKCTLRKLSVKEKGIKPGDIFIMRFGSTGKGHTGFIAKIVGNVAYTIEGNTNDDGSREGYEVARKERLLTSFHGIIQLQ